MPATSEDQRKLMCIALSIQRGETPESYSKEAALLAKSMSETDLKDYCESEVVERKSEKKYPFIGR